MMDGSDALDVLADEVGRWDAIARELEPEVLTEFHRMVLRAIIDPEYGQMLMAYCLGARFDA
jgi:hypothetical protein